MFQIDYEFGGNSRLMDRMKQFKWFFFNFRTFSWNFVSFLEKVSIYTQKNQFECSVSTLNKDNCAKPVDVLGNLCEIRFNFDYGQECLKLFKKGMGKIENFLWSPIWKSFDWVFGWKMTQLLQNLNFLSLEKTKLCVEIRAWHNEIMTLQNFLHEASHNPLPTIFIHTYKK